MVGGYLLKEVSITHSWEITDCEVFELLISTEMCNCNVQAMRFYDVVFPDTVICFPVCLTVAREVLSFMGHSCSCCFPCMNPGGLLLLLSGT